MGALSSLAYTVKHYSTSPLESQRSVRLQRGSLGLDPVSAQGMLEADGLSCSARIGWVGSGGMSPRF